MIEVRLFATLPEHSRRRSRRIEVEAVPGLSVRMVMAQEGIPEDLVRIIMVNGVHAGFDTELHEGDRLGLFPPVGGG